ncbi:two-component system, OmpR family, sensor kinase [biofilm metagenome]
MSLAEKFNFQQRLSLAILGAILLAGGIFIGFQAFAMAKYAGNYTVRYWQEYANTFSGSVQYWVILDSSANAKSAAHSFAKDPNIVRAAIYGNDSLIAASNDRTICTSASNSFNEPFYMDMGEVWCFYSPVFQGKSLLGHVELTVSKAEYNSVVKSLVLASFTIAVICAVLIFYMVNRFSLFFTSVLLQISSVMRSVAQGAKGGRVTFSGAADINSIRDDFNLMLNKIELNAQILEEAVEARTSELNIALDNSVAANRYKSQIMGVTSHEMKTPLHAVSSYIHLAIERLRDTHTVDDAMVFLSKALVRTDDLREIIDNILLQSRLEADKFEFSATEIALQPFMEQCADKMGALLEKNRNRLVLSGDSMAFVSDDEVLRHIVNNLLSNACKFTVDGLIELKWRLYRDNLIIQVYDTGCGIPSYAKGHIFEPFWQADMSFSRKHGGHGLGLSIIKHFLQRLDGRITVSDNVSSGTVFTVTLPSLTYLLVRRPSPLPERST